MIALCPGAQEDAEAHCTAPHRAPELFDVPSHCVVDERVDVWSLGCLLCASGQDFHMSGVSFLAVHVVVSSTAADDRKVPAGFS